MEAINISPPDILTSIADRYPLRTKSEKKVSDYILQKRAILSICPSLSWRWNAA